MDDAYERAAQRENQMELVRREMERKSLDTIRIFNPLDFTFKYKWDNRPFSIASKSYDEVERYLAEAYAKKIIAYMIGQQQVAKGEELKALREKQLGKTFIDKYEENKEIWDRVPRLDDPELIKEIGDIVVIGLVREYGIEDVPDRTDPTQEKQESPYDNLFKKMDRKILEPFDQTEELNA